MPQNVRGELTTPEKYFSDIPLTEEELHNKVILCERQIVNSPVENVLVFDECGNIIVHLIGNQKVVNLPMKYWNAAKVITHNHPDGATLSAVDVSQIFRTPVDELRAVSGDVWYSVKRGENCTKQAQTVLSELSKHLHENDYYAVKDICDKNGILVEIDSEKGMCRTAKPKDMDYAEYLDLREKSIKESSILRILRLHQALSDYAEKNDIIYTFGVLKP